MVTDRPLEKLERMERLIVIPDVHGRKFWRSAVQGNEEEKIIFLGDYVDPYGWEGILPGEAYDELLDVISFKKAHPDNVVLLLGNHDLGYLDRSVCECRMDYYREKMIRKSFLDNLGLFDIAHMEKRNGDDILFTHAGIAEGWVRNNTEILGPGKFNPLTLNEMLHDDKRRPGLLSALSDISWYRGGLDSVGSPIWADVHEFLEGERFLDGYLHIFGHTLHEGDPINVLNHGICVDCAKAFIYEGYPCRHPIRPASAPLLPSTGNGPAASGNRTR